MSYAATTPKMSHSGLNLLRIVLSSYFIALSLGLIKGTDLTILAAIYMPKDVAQFMANTAVFLLAYLVLMGMWLRPAALILAGYVLACSGFTTMAAHNDQAMSDFWRDVALVAGLMMTYLQSGLRDANRRALFRRKPRARKVILGETVTPRRIRPAERHTPTPRPAAPANNPSEAANVVNIFAA